MDLVFDKTILTSGTIDRRELLFKAMGGLAGAALGWLPIELVSYGHSLTEAPSATRGILNLATIAFFSGMVGGLVLASDDKTIQITPRLKRRLLRGFVVCFVLAIVPTIFANYLFGAILNAGGWGVGQAGGIAYLILGRIVTWSLLGTMLGAGVGLAGFSFGSFGKSLQNVFKGAIGGLVGGFIGGMLFDSIGQLSQSGLLSRLIGFCVIGLAIGFFIGLVQELTKSAWLAVEAGRLRGRQFRIEGATTMIGRAEENVVGLFGDPAVMPRHAVIEHRADRYTIKTLAVQAGTIVNGQRVETSELRDGDRIKIGNYELIFHERATTVPAGARSTPPAAADVPHSTISEPSGASTLQYPGAPSLVDSEGRRFTLRTAAPTQIGRALDNDIVINDASVSRHHAQIESRNGAFVLRDLGSQNGTWMRGERITELAIGDGDSIKLGDAVLTFHG